MENSERRGLYNGCGPQAAAAAQVVPGKRTRLLWERTRPRALPAGLHQKLANEFAPTGAAAERSYRPGDTQGRRISTRKWSQGSGLAFCGSGLVRELCQ